MNPDLLPIPEFVLNAAIRDDFQVTDKGSFYTFSNGDKERLVFGGDVTLHDDEVKEKTEFKSWLETKELTIPEAFQEENDDLRFLNACQHDF